MKKLFSLFIILPLAAFAQAPAGYYNGTENLTGYALKTKLHDIVSSKTFSYNYSNLPNFYNQTDLDRYYENDGTILDIYSEIPNGPDAYSYNTTQLVSGASAEGLGYNREHMMPQSTFESSYPMYSDLHFVIPTDARVNQLRSNYPYGIAGKKVWYEFTNGSKQADNGTPGAAYAGRIYEPIDEFKGDVARALLYFIVRYEDKLPWLKYQTDPSPAKDTSPMDGTVEKGLDDWFLKMLLQWNAQDPVSQREIDRNNAVFAIQKNRNPFVDDPSWVSQIWNQTVSTAAPSVPTNLQVSASNAYYSTLSWQPSASPDVLGYKVYQNDVLIGYTKNTTFTADHLQPAQHYVFKVQAYNNAYQNSGFSDAVSLDPMLSDISAKDLQITKYIEGTGSNQALEITNRTGHAVNLKDYRLSIQFRSGSNFYFGGERFGFEGMLENGQSFVVISPFANLSCYDISQARFVTNAPPMTFNGSNYVELQYRDPETNAYKTADAMGATGTDNSATLANVSLYRKTDVKNPNTKFNISEWDVFPQDYCEGLGTLAAAETIGAKSLIVYPNPATDQLFVKGENLNKITTAKIYDASGKLILSIVNPFRNGDSINIQQLSTGVYFLQTEQGIIRFIKK